jgi:hypothetical protein
MALRLEELPDEHRQRNSKFDNQHRGEYTHSTHFIYTLLILDWQRGTRDGIPQELRRSTFVGQPQVLETLTDLQNALVAGDEITSMKASIFSRIEEWESTTNHPSIRRPQAISPSRRLHRPFHNTVKANPAMTRLNSELLPLVDR